MPERAVTPGLDAVAAAFRARHFDQEREVYAPGLSVFLETPEDVHRVLLVLEREGSEWAQALHAELLDRLAAPPPGQSDAKATPET
jgi:hypothetical protein